jgi:hypothetical protein
MPFVSGLISAKNCVHACELMEICVKGAGLHDLNDLQNFSVKKFCPIDQQTAETGLSAQQNLLFQSERRHLVATGTEKNRWAPYKKGVIYSHATQAPFSALLHSSCRNLSKRSSVQPVQCSAVPPSAYQTQLNIHLKTTVCLDVA